MKREEGVLAGWATCLPSNRTVPLIAVLHVGVQGKILFALRGLLLKKVGKPLTEPSTPVGAHVPPGLGQTPPCPLPHGLSLLALLGVVCKQRPWSGY